MSVCLRVCVSVSVCVCVCVCVCVSVCVVVSVFFAAGHPHKVTREGLPRRVHEIPGGLDAMNRGASERRQDSV